MKPAPFVLALALAGCAFGNSDPQGPPADAPAGDLPPAPDGNDGCNVSLSFTPQLPVARPSELITVQSHVFNAPGAIEYQWHVDFFGMEITPRFQNGNTEIMFPTPQPGVYLVSLTITGSSTFCAPASVPINVGAVGARTARVRLHIVAPGNSDALTVDRT